MGRKIPIVSFLCGAISRKKNTPPQNSVENPNGEHPDTAFAAAKPPSPGSETQEENPSSTTAHPPLTDQEEVQSLPIPPPPGRQSQPHHMRAASCHHQHSRSNSAVSKLSSSLSMRVLTASRREDCGNKKKLKHEDSIWKKTIILGEKCKVPEEDDDTILYDENGNRISSYHPKNKNNVNVLSSRQTSFADQDSVPPRLGPNNEELSRK